MGGWLRGDGSRPALPQGLFASGFRGSAVFDESARADPSAALDIHRASGSTTLSLDQRAMVAHLRRLADALGPLSVTEFLVTAIAPPAPSATARQATTSAGSTNMATELRAELVGQSPGGARASHVGTWRITWQRADTGWQIVEWTAGPSVTSRAPAPLF